MTDLHAITLGQRSAGTLKTKKHFSVIGVTSRGVFLRDSQQQIIFLSTEPFRGPLTINIPQTVAWGSYCKVGDQIAHNPKMQRLKSKHLTIHLSTAIPWQVTPDDFLGHPVSTTRLHQTVSTFNDQFLIDILHSRSGGSETRLERIIHTLVSALEEHEWEQAGECIHQLLGIGRGLTPEGDDFLIGLTFGLAYLSSDPRPLELFRAATPIAYTQTTLISANLIEAAIDGQADERFATALASFSDPNSNLDEAIEGLLSWGSTSGRMALAGLLSAARITEKST